MSFGLLDKFSENDSTFDVDWLLHQVENEVTLAEQEPEALRKYTSSFLNYEATAAQDIHRSRRAAPLAMMALASVDYLDPESRLEEDPVELKEFLTLAMINPRRMQKIFKNSLTLQKP